MTSLEQKPTIRLIIEEWYRREDGNQHITGQISEYAKERLARDIEIMFSPQSETKEIVKDNLEKPRRGRPARVDR